MCFCKNQKYMYFMFFFVSIGKERSDWRSKKLLVPFLKKNAMSCFPSIMIIKRVHPFRKFCCRQNGSNMRFWLRFSTVKALLIGQFCQKLDHCVWEVVNKLWLSGKRQGRWSLILYYYLSLRTNSCVQFDFA